MTGPALWEWGERLLDTGKEFAASGPLHRRRLSNIGTRISVSGVRGKSTAVRWLHDVFYRRDYDTYSKVTGIDPISRYNETEREVARGAKVRLYENERELGAFDTIDAAIVENQGIREYTTRLVNEQFVRPHVVFLTNIREDHLDTMGGNRLAIARSLARSIPSGTHVVSGEQDPRIKEYLEAELDRRDATVTHVRLPPERKATLGAELAYGLNPVLRAVDEPLLDETELESYLDRIAVSWTRLPDGRVFDAAAANDTQSTEFIRRRLTAASDEVVQPLLYLRADRRGRTAAFVRYLDALADRGAVEQVRVVGRDARLFDRHSSCPVIVHDEDATSPTELLDAALADGWPVLLMGNTVSEFMETLATTVEERQEYAVEQ